jgi:flagellar basal body rod protein FlgF
MSQLTDFSSTDGHRDLVVFSDGFLEVAWNDGKAGFDFAGATRVDMTDQRIKYMT